MTTGTKRGPKPKLSSTGAVMFKGMDDELVSIHATEGMHQSERPGHCATCEQPYRKDDWVSRNKNGQLVGMNCCGANDSASAPASYSQLMEDDAEGREFVPISQVLPNGKTKADMCRLCFQITASNGSCGC